MPIPTNPSTVPTAVRTRPPLPRKGRLELHDAVLRQVCAFLGRKGCTVRTSPSSHDEAPCELDVELCEATWTTSATCRNR